MTKKQKYIILISAACVGVGILLSVVALIMMRFDFGAINQMNEYEYQTKILTDSFTKLVVKDEYMGVRILSSEDDTCKILYAENDDLKYNIYVEEETLFITYEDTSHWTDHIGIFWGEWKEETCIKLYLPKREYEKLLIESTSGDVQAEKEHIFGEVEILTTSGDIDFHALAEKEFKGKSTSGDINVKNMKHGNVTIGTTSGEIEVENMTVDNLEINTTSGDIEVDRTTIDNLKIDSTSGDIDMVDVKVAEELQLRTVSGDIDMELSDANVITIHTTSGDVGGTLLSDKNFSCQTTSGDIRLPQSKEDAGRCEIQTVSGDVALKIIQ